MARGGSRRLHEIDRQVGGDEHHLEWPAAAGVLQPDALPIEGDRFTDVLDVENGVIEFGGHRPALYDEAGTAPGRVRQGYGATA
jgi:hypothetical protein